MDNPPFSIITKIVEWYLEHEIPFFLFAPGLTNFNIARERVCHVIENVPVFYENGARVNTSFVTNLDDAAILTDPDLYRRVNAANSKDGDSNKKMLPKYEYPPQVLTVSKVERLARRGVRFRVEREDVFHIRGLDQQKQYGKSVFGSGFLVSEKVAAAREAAEKSAEIKENIVNVWQLSEREKAIVKQLGGENEY